MSDEKSDDTAPAPKKKKGKLLLIVGALVVLGGGTTGGLWAAGIGPFKHAEGGVIAHEGPKLVPKSEQKRVAAAAGEGKEGGSVGTRAPSGVGGEKYASNYYAMDKEFTANLQDSVHFIQVGLAISTPYDDTVIENVKTNEIAVRSAILMTLSDTSEEQVFTMDGKKQLQQRLTKAINDTLKEKEGFGGVGNVYFTNFVVQ